MSRNYIVDRLNSYFREGYFLNRCPLLIGPSGVAKSALIKQASKDFNMKLIDIRTAFMSRLDIEGLSQKIEVNGEYYSASSPMFELIRCTDEYLKVCRGITNLVAAAFNEETDESVKEKLCNTLEYLKKESRTPILIFDEISRGEASVRQVLTKILTDKEFMGYSMREARVVAATNSQLTTSGEKLDIYAVNEAYDVAFYDRFESIYVSPKTMIPFWKSWASENLNKRVVLESDGNEYDEAHFTSPDQDLVEPFKCFRTWELASRVYDALDSGSSLSDSFVSTILGGSGFLSMDQFIHDCIETNVPGLIISPSGLGKTSRVRNVVKSNDYEMISINLSEVDRVDLEGLPVKVSLFDAIKKGCYFTDKLEERVKVVISNSLLPSEVTIRAPKKEYVDTFNRALNSGRKVIIYFDEMNRVQNVSVMSAIFQVISDNRLFGVDFDPKNVRCICSCNLDDNCSDAQELDPALCARFAIWRKKEYTRSDAVRFRKYVSDSDYSPVVRDWILSIDKDDLVKIIDSVNSRTMEISASSTRGIEDLSTTLRYKTPLLCGKLIFGSTEAREKVSNYMRFGTDNGSVKKLVQVGIREWAGKYLDSSDISNGKSLDKLVKIVYERYESLTKELLEDIIEIDNYIYSYRLNFFKIFLGDNAGKFLDFYNSYDTTCFTGNESSKEVNDYVVSHLSSIPNLVSNIKELPKMKFQDKSKVARVIYRAVPKEMRKEFIIELNRQEAYDFLHLYDDLGFNSKIAKEIML